MGTIRVHEIAKKLGLENRDVLLRLRAAGIRAASNISLVDDSCVDLIKKSLAQPKPTPARKKTVKKKAAAKAPARKKVAAKKKVAVKKKAAVKKKVAAKAPAKPAPAAPAPPAVAKPAPAAPAPPAAAKPAPAAPAPPAAAKPAPQAPAAPAASKIAPPPARPAPAAAPPQAAAPTPPTPAQPEPSRPAAAKVAGPPAAPTRTPAAPARPPVAPRPAAAPARPAPARAFPPRRGRVGPPMRPPRRKARKSRAARAARPPHPTPPPPPPVPVVMKPMTIAEGTTVRELAERMSVKVSDLVRRLMSHGVMATINLTLSPDRAAEVAKDFGFEVETIAFEDHALMKEREAVKGGKPKTRPPVVTIMGHVDHGKTTLLDALRESNIVATEFGGITQHIGAYTVKAKNRMVTFLDTPGHEAFTLMRARGAQATDIVVLVVAADDGVMPQTVEAINHARAAEVPMVVAINKIDKPEANAERVKRDLADHGILVEAWGGDTVSVEISAKERTGLDELLDMLLLVADIRELEADAALPASGIVLEAKLDRARGPVATVLVQQGTLHVGETFVAGSVPGKARALFDDLGRRIKEAGPSIPVEVLGLEGIPAPGDRFKAIDEAKARQIGAYRQQKAREETLRKSSRVTLDQLFGKIKEGEVKELNLILKADVQGSIEAITKTLERLSNDEVKVRFLHAGVGAVYESDILLASSSNAIVIGFNVRPDQKAKALIEKEEVDVRLHTVIYEVSDEIRKALVGLLEPTLQESRLGRAEVRNTFKVPKYGTIAGTYVLDGRMVRNADVRLLRDNVVVYQGKIVSLRRFKDDVNEVKSGYECGLAIGNFSDIKVGDVIEAFKIEKTAPREVAI
jgi:translation initiation factor IF-2